MIKYAKVLNEETGRCNVGSGNDTAYYINMGMKEMDVDLSDVDSNWYLSEKCPHKSDEQKLEEAKQAKYEEALIKAYDYQQNGTVEHKNCIFEMSDSNRKNLSDTEEALKLQGLEETTWLDKDDNLVTLTVDDIQYIRLNLILAEIQKLWIVKYPAYKTAIAEAQTIEEVNAIVINYADCEPQSEPEPEPTEITEASISNLPLEVSYKGTV